MSLVRPCPVGSLKVLIITETNDTINLKVQASSFELINKVRRRLMQEVSVLAIDSVSIIRNSSPVYDELIGHRLEFIPFISSSEISEEIVTIDMNGPGPVLSSHIQGAVRPTYNDILIVKLKQNEQLKLQATLRRGCGSTNDKWNPIIHFTYKEVTEGLFEVCIVTTGAVTWKELCKFFY